MKSFKNWMENKYTKNKDIINDIPCECRCIPCSKRKDCSECSCKDCKCRGCKCSHKSITKNNNNPVNQPASAVAKNTNKPENKNKAKPNILDSFEDKFSK